LLVEDRNKLFRDDLIEPGKKGLDLIFDRRMQPILRRKLHEFAPVLQCDRDPGTILLEIDDFGDTELLEKCSDSQFQNNMEATTYLISFDAESELKRTWIILENPAERIVVLRVHPFNVAIVDGFPK